MSQIEYQRFEIEAMVHADIDLVWQCWTQPAHVVHWNFATEEWHAPAVENDLREGGRFKVRMEAKDGSMGFDFNGVHDEIKLNEFIHSTLDDGRKMKARFLIEVGGVRVVEEVEAETENPIEMQQMGWQMILNNFKRYVESLSKTI